MSETTETETPAEADEPTSSAPLVFISHDSRDAALAEALSKMLGTVSTGMLKTFRSSDRKGSQGFEYGVEWYPELMRVLHSACDVVCLLTERSLGRPWILYEAGVAKGGLALPVHGLALGVPLTKASVGPFAQFQNCDGDADSLMKLVMQLVRRLPNAEPDQEIVRAQVEMFRARVEEVLESQPGSDDSDDTDRVETSAAQLFEEIKVMFQDLPSRIERIADGGLPGARVRKRPLHPGMHPGMIEEMVMMMSRGERRSGGMAALMIGSLFQTEAPWLYALGVEAYRASLDADPAKERQGCLNFMRAAEFIAMGPFSRELTRGSRELHMLLRELPMLVDRFMFMEDPGPEAAME